MLDIASIVFWKFRRVWGEAIVGLSLLGNCRTKPFVTNSLVCGVNVQLLPVDPVISSAADWPTTL